jgi:hypothetical protein
MESRAGGNDKACRRTIHTARTQKVRAITFMIDDRLKGLLTIERRRLIAGGA